MEHSRLNKCAVVVIGRNEGERLKLCLNVLLTLSVNVVYVDSGSTDDSVDYAKNLGMDVMALDLSIPFTAARARNVGAEFLLARYDVEYLQFIDGDCEIRSNWMNTAVQFLMDNREYAVVCGRLRERYPNKSIYNQLCDFEWNSNLGDIDACGGITMMRSDVFIQHKGFREDLIAGEEPELCLRFRQAGWKIRRLSDEMAIHDADMMRFNQWWQRAKRGGYACAEGYFLHRKEQEQYRKKSFFSILLWAAIFPILILSLTIYNVVFLLLAVLYPVQVIRLATQCPIDCNFINAFYYASFTVLGKFPQLVGVSKFLFNKFTNKAAILIEHK